MNLFKCLQLLICIFFIHFSANVSAQNSWTSCSSTAGLLDGSTTSLYLTDTTAAAVPTTNPSPSTAIPTSEYVIMLHGSMASDNMGWAIISSSPDGRVSPASLGFSVGDTFSIALFSYDLQQIKMAVQGILFNTVPFVGSCCALLDTQAPSPGVCDSLNAAGIMDSSDVNDISDLLAFLGAFSGGGSTSLGGLNLALMSINGSIGTLSAVGCTNGVAEICYATDSLPSNHAHFVVTSMTNNTKIEGTSSLKIAVNPNPFLDQISTGILTENGGEHALRVFDATGRLVHEETNELNVGEQMITLNLGHLNAGLYYLQVSGNSNVVTQKIIKR